MIQCGPCGEGGIVTEATHEGWWVSGDGTVARETTPLCAWCLDAGDPTGPGYQLVTHTIGG